MCPQEGLGMVLLARSSRVGSRTMSNLSRQVRSKANRLVTRAKVCPKWIFQGIAIWAPSSSFQSHVRPALLNLLVTVGPSRQFRRMRKAIWETESAAGCKQPPAPDLAHLESSPWTKKLLPRHQVYLARPTNEFELKHWPESTNIPTSVTIMGLISLAVG